MFMLQPGMGVRLGTYYRRTGEDDSGHAALAAELRAARAEGQVRGQAAGRRPLGAARGARAKPGPKPRARPPHARLIPTAPAPQTFPPTSAEPVPPGAPRPPWMIGTAHALDPEAPSPFRDLGRIAPGEAQFAVDAGCYRRAGGAGRGQVGMALSAEAWRATPARPLPPRTPALCPLCPTAREPTPTPTPTPRARQPLPHNLPQGARRGARGGGHGLPAGPLRRLGGPAAARDHGRGARGPAAPGGARVGAGQRRGGALRGEPAAGAGGGQGAGRGVDGCVSVWGRSAARGSRSRLPAAAPVARCRLPPTPCPGALPPLPRPTCAAPSSARSRSWRRRWTRRVGVGGGRGG
jgi:hypothetical protein